MFVLKAEKNPRPGQFVSNFRQTIEVLTSHCNMVPKTAFGSHRTTRTLVTEIPRVPTYPSDLSPSSSRPRSLSSHAVCEFEMEMEMEMEIEAEEVLVLDEPVGI